MLAAGAVLTVAFDTGTEESAWDEVLLLIAVAFVLGLGGFVWLVRASARGVGRSRLGWGSAILALLPWPFCVIVSYVIFTEGIGPLLLAIGPAIALAAAVVKARARPLV